ncbi:MAG: VPS10 domain-containing protein [Akkermansiaceae bacterium]
MCPRASHATWYEEVMKPGADIIMMDLRWPWWPNATYYANWNTGFETGEGSLSFYAGFVTTLKGGPDGIPNPDESAQSGYYPGNVWSWWGTNKAGVAPIYVDCAPSLAFKNQSAGEGCTASLIARGGAWPFMSWKRWYTQVGRLWVPNDPDANHAYCGRWIKDVENNKWHLVAILKVPFRVEGFGKNQGFIESLGDGKAVRPLDRRFGYYRKDGEWHSSNKLVINKRSHVVMKALPEGDHEYHAIEYAGSKDHLPWAIKGGAILPGDRRVEIEVRQPDQPKLDQPAIENVRASHLDGQVVVSWEVPQDASPFFEYKVEVFDNPDCRGTPATAVSRRMPSARHASVDTDVDDPTIRVTAWDIFDQQATPVVLRSERSKVIKGDGVPDSLLPGVRYQILKRQRGQDKRDNWDKLADLPSGKVIKKGISRGFDIRVRGKEYSNFAIVFEGLLEVPRDGTYVFYTRIDDVYRLEVGGEEIIVRDRTEGTTEHAGTVSLEKGVHPIKLTYLAGNPLAFNFNIDWEGPGLRRQPIPNHALKCVDTDSFPTLTMETKTSGDGTGRVEAVVDPRGHDLDRIRMFLGDFQIVDGEGAELVYNGALPEGEHDLWVRIEYDGKHTIDLDGGTLTATGKPISEEWTLRDMGNEGAVAGLWQSDTKDFSFFGQGIHGAFQRMEGDFTVTCRIDDYSDSGVHRDSWVGVAAFENAAERSWKWGKHFYLVQTSGDGMRTAPDHGDLGASRKSQYRFPEDHPWVRICRQGDLFMAWSSPDGENWILGGTRHEKMSEEMDVGLFIRIPGHGSEAYYQAQISGLEVEAGIPETCRYPEPVAAKGTGGDRLTGVVIARSDNNVVVVRSTSKGLMRTTDGGKTWASINGQLKGSANAVRSVAIHPENPDIILRAAGKAKEASLESGLWMTTDGGRSWTQLDFPGDFDGYGPSALCGEVVAFDHTNPDLVFAGTESKGFFKSEDGGKTWRSLGWEDSRFTSVEIFPWGEGRLAATTCADNWMELLGRGKPVLTTLSEESKGLVGKAEEDRLQVYHARKCNGFYNVAFSKMMKHPQNFRYGTARGLEHNYGGALYAFPSYKNLEWMRPITAIHGTSLDGSGNNNGLMITQALAPEQAGRISRTTKSWARIWHWTELAGDVPEGGLIATFGEYQKGKKWWFVFADGLYFSPDGGIRIVKILPANGGDPPGNMDH